MRIRIENLIEQVTAIFDQQSKEENFKMTLTETKNKLQKLSRQ
jgi:hypothetical protein